MNDLETVRVTFTCSRCGSINELTAAHLHEATMIHCSRCSNSVAPLGVLSRKPTDEVPSQPAIA
jgi:DNA-directed RNA polymerase subunit RPC12/RpoP